MSAEIMSWVKFLMYIGAFVTLTFFVVSVIANYAAKAQIETSLLKLEFIEKWEGKTYPIWVHKFIANDDKDLIKGIVDPVNDKNKQKENKNEKPD